MSRLWMSVVLMLAMQMQGKHAGACDHAAPPVGMRWVCADNNTCDCRLVANGSGGEENSGKTVTKPVPRRRNPASLVACVSSRSRPIQRQRAWRRSRVLFQPPWC
jgi:hypothetical protein